MQHGSSSSLLSKKRLLHAMTECQSSLSGAEVKRNVHGPMYCYEFSSAISGALDSQYGLSAVNKMHCVETPIYRDEVGSTKCIRIKRNHF